MIEAGGLKICAQVWDSLLRGRQNGDCLAVCKSVGYFLYRDLDSSTLCVKEYLFANDF